MLCAPAITRHRQLRRSEMVAAGPDIPTISATKITAPPEWALLQRQLFTLLEKAGDLATEKYARPDGRVYHFFGRRRRIRKQVHAGHLLRPRRRPAVPRHSQARVGRYHLALQRGACAAGWRPSPPHVHAPASQRVLEPGRPLQRRLVPHGRGQPDALRLRGRGPG